MGEASKPSVDFKVIKDRDLRVDWGEWPEGLDSTDTRPRVVKDREVLARPEDISSYGGSLYQLVDECARRLELRRVACGEDVPAEEFRIPFMESEDLPCGFQTRLTKGTLEDLASRFHFHFVGDSTTRRLAESFMSIVTGEGSTHRLYHEDRNLSSGSLQVSFHWAPYCSEGHGFPIVSTPFKEVMSKQEEDKETIGDRRAVFVTAFGIWDAEHLGGDASAFSNCTEAVRWLVQTAPYSDTSAESDGGKDASSPPPPLVFLLQDNTFLPGSEEDAFLKQLHQVQREVVESDREESHAEVYLVHDRDSLYETMSCYRRAEEVHFLEPVKLVEGKMLWDLIALVVDRGVLDRAEQISSYGGSLYHLVDECARRLELRSVACGEEAHAEEFRIPFMESGDLPCGFQTRMTKGTLENLASRFHFHFVGDSTTRRLAESFVSIVTGEGSTHKVYHKDRNLSSGSLQVSFHWAPYCSGEQDFPAVSTPFKNVMSKRDGEAERIGDKRAVFVTAFGIWDVEHLDVTTALSSCTEVVRWLVQEAPYSDTSAESDGGKDASSPPPPLVFIFQDNTFLPGSLKDAFLKQLHRVQLEFVESDREESHAEVYLVHDRDSLYETMSCYRRAEEVHFLEPMSGAREPSIEVGEESVLQLVDWGEWPGESASIDTWPGQAADRGVFDRSEQSTSYGGSLYHLVDECARRLELRSVACGEEAHAEEFRIPFMESGDLPCGFQTRMTKGTLENLAARFHFHFVGDSTTRRLAESFVSIVTGEGSTHELYHEDRNFSSGGLQTAEA
eukprot:g16716.t1